MITVKNIPDPFIHCDFENVYYPSEDSYLLIDYFREKIDNNYFDDIKLESIGNILDMGTGTGIIAIFFQLIQFHRPKFNPRIFASDILEDSIRCAKNNEKLNNFDNTITYIQSDLFKSFPKSLKSTFNIIVFNPPYLPSSPSVKENLPKKNIDYSWEGGQKGFEIIVDFLKGAKKYLDLEKDHYIYFISSSRSKLNELEIQINDLGYMHEKLEKIHIFFEDIILNRLYYVNI